MRDRERRKDATLLPHLALTHEERVFLDELIALHGDDLRSTRPHPEPGPHGHVGYGGIDLRALRRTLQMQVLHCDA